jgi:acetyl esterase
MLHPQARALLDLIEASGLPQTQSLSPADARRVYRDRRSSTQPRAPQVASVTDLSAPGPNGAIALRHYRPLLSTAAAKSDSALPLLLFFHGGGWVIGDLDTHDTLCRELANQAGCAVIAVDYRLGPEHRFPAAVDDCIAALKFVTVEAATLNIDPRRIAVGGDSAGGNLAAVVALDARDNNGPAIAFQLLIYPVTDVTADSGSQITNASGYLLTRDTMRYFHDHYVDNPAHDRDWRLSPLLADNLANLPAALVLTAGFDPLRDEGQAYADRLSAAKVPCTSICFERQIHGFILMGKVLEEANTAVMVCAAALQKTFGSER